MEDFFCFALDLPEGFSLWAEGDPLSFGWGFDDEDKFEGVVGLEFEEMKLGGVVSGGPEPVLVVKDSSGGGHSIPSGDKGLVECVAGGLFPALVEAHEYGLVVGSAGLATSSVVVAEGDPPPLTLGVG